MARSTNLLLFGVVLVASSLACQTLLGPPEGQGLANNSNPIKASPTPLPTPTPHPSTRLSGEDLPELTFGPPGESPREQDRPRLSGQPQTLDTAHFRIHYTLSGRDAVPSEDGNGNSHPDYVEDVARAVEFSWFAEVEHFGWTAPPPDELGGDERYDVYLENILDDEYAGYTDGDYDHNPSSDNPHSIRVENSALSSFFVLDNDYAEYEENRIPWVETLDYMRVTVAHELHHSIQFGYDGYEPHDWLWEASATWMQDEVFDLINEGIDILPGEFKSPDSCQIEPGDNGERVEDDDHWYAEWMFVRFLSERYGHIAVRELWENAIGHDRYDVWDLLLESKGTNLNAFFQDYSLALLTRDFQEGGEYPVLRLEGEAHMSETFDPVDGVAQMGADYVEILGPGVATVRLDGEGMAILGVGIRGGQSFLFAPNGSAVTLDTDAFEHSYLIVMNLERAFGLANCHFENYSLILEAGGRPQTPFAMLPAANFDPPGVDGLLDPGLFDEE